MTIAGIDLSATEFWGLPLNDRATAFALLRAQPQPPFFAEPETPFAEPGPGYYALVRYADVVEASKHPEVFSSAKGATSIPGSGFLGLGKLAPPGMMPRRAVQLRNEEPITIGTVSIAHSHRPNDLDRTRLRRGCLPVRRELVTRRPQSKCPRPPARELPSSQPRRRLFAPIVAFIQAKPI